MDLLKLGALLDSDKYIIPVYQREFAWSEGELIRLVKDIEDSRKEGKEEYYMGSLVTFFIDGYYELVDGQQRLTALSLLFSLAGDGKKINLSYEARPSSVKSLEELQKGNTGSGHRFFKSAQILKSEVEKTDKVAFFEYLREHVYILRTTLSSSTDLNHYFKIMNSRGPQCTKGDVVFSYLLEKLEDPKEREIAKVIWKGLDSFSGFLAGCIPERLYNRMIYGDGVAPLLESDYSSWWKMITSHTEGDKDNITCTLEDALVFDSEEFIRPAVRSEKGGVFFPIISFEEFILYAVELVLNKENRCDDKQILNICSVLKSLDREEVKCFLYNTLILRYLFDTYVVKRNSEGWCLLRYRDLNEYTPAFETLNRDIVNIESLYASSLDHKEWLMPLFKFLKSNVNASGPEILDFLKALNFSSQRFELYKQNYYEKGIQSPPYLIVENEKLIEVK